MRIISAIKDDGQVGMGQKRDNQKQLNQTSDLIAMSYD